MDVKELIKVLKAKGHTVFTDPEKLNIVGIRKFDGMDRLYAFWNTPEGKWEMRDWEITTDPATKYLKSLKSISGSDMSKGAAILKAGQWPYKTGLHKGKYKALVQDGKVQVYRDYDRNAYLLFDDSTIQTGVFGINIHKDQYSEGCQVFQVNPEFDEFMTYVNRHEKRYGNKFLYTLIDEHIVAQRKRRSILLGGMAISSTVAVAAFVYLYFFNKKK